MFTTLLESGSRSSRHEGWLSASTGVHLMLIAGAVVLTAQREVQRIDPPEQVDIVYTRNASPAEPPLRRVHSGSSHRESGRTLRFPTLRDLTDIVGVTTPNLDVNTASGSLSSDLGGVDARCNDTAICVLVPPFGDGPLSAGQVEKPALAAPGNAQPTYPEMLRTAGVEGSVLMRFVIDTTGAVERASITVVRTDHGLFASAVRSVLMKHRFFAAEAGGRKVRMLVEQRFDFAIDR